MKNSVFALILTSLVSLGFNFKLSSQISPGDLAKVHSHLEGMSNCTKCHTVGAKVSNNNCLACHTEIRDLITKQKGYHASAEVKGKECASCHNDHHGRNFQIIRFNTAGFQHNLTGFRLEGAHGKQQCNACHTSKFISNKKLRSKSGTYLGLNTSCISCHTDYHQKTLPGSCSKCHGQESFKPAVNFNHNNAGFHLIGKHQSVDCSKCHPLITKEGKAFQKFKGIGFANCTSCHDDVHQNKFGQNCKQCHSESSFHLIKNNKSFDHDKTGFKLLGKHVNVSCSACHKKGITNTLKHDNCNDCHSDYHKGQFAKSGISPDCIDCHTINGFSPSTFTIDNHNQCEFPLKGAHLAIACNECHLKKNVWNFRNLGKSCVDCHTNIHKNTISAKYYPNQSCISCHAENSWSEVNFMHTRTNFPLTGAHITASCRACHYFDNKPITEKFKFAGLSKNCNNCHIDNHNKQFEKNGITDCNNCHGTNNWKAGKFNHDNTAFKLDGKHANLACAACHKTQQNEKFIVYKIKKFKCEDCHLR